MKCKYCKKKLYPGKDWGTGGNEWATDLRGVNDVCYTREEIEGDDMDSHIPMDEFNEYVKLINKTKCKK